MKARYVYEPNVFRLGNSQSMSTDMSVLIPVRFGLKTVIVKAAVLPKSCAPLLLSKEFLKQLGATMDLSTNEVSFEKLGVTFPMGTTSKGHYAIPLFESPLKRVFRKTHRKHTNNEHDNPSSDSKECRNTQLHPDGRSDTVSAAFHQASSTNTPVRVAPSPCRRCQALTRPVRAHLRGQQEEALEK